MADIFRDSICGQIVRVLFRGRLLYADEQQDFQIPSFEERSLEKSGEIDLSAADTEGGSLSSETHATSKIGIVGWYGPEDPDNPQNWSTAKKMLVSTLITLLTFSGEFQ